MQRRSFFARCFGALAACVVPATVKAAPKMLTEAEIKSCFEGDCTPIGPQKEMEFDSDWVTAWNRGAISVNDYLRSLGKPVILESEITYKPA